MDWRRCFQGTIRQIAILAAWLALATAAPSRALEVLSVRALDDGPRTSVMVLVRNDSDRPATVRDLRLHGMPIREAMAWDDQPSKLGKRVDWFDVRPRTIPPGEAGVIVLGWLTRELLVPSMRLEAVTEEKTWDLSGPTPRAELLSIASATFDQQMRQLTVLIRNRTDEPVIFRRMLFNGRPVEARLRAAAARPGMPLAATVALPQPMALGADANLLVEGLSISGPVKATAWFRAFPAQSLNYLFDGKLADARDLAEKHIDVPTTNHEAEAAEAGQIDAGHGVMPAPAAKRLAQRAAALAADPQAWGWYLQDDAALGAPRPQALVDLSHFIREHGSPQRQVLCNPADNRRYAWVSDTYMNYDYHVTQQGADPTVFYGGHSPELTRALNEPAPLVYLVDAVGQSVRWITPVEEELASYAMIGRGVGFPGWFLAVSLSEQGGERHGGLDRLETMPWRYQEGVVACKQVWDHVGRIAGLLHLLAPHLAASVPLAGQLRDDRLEVLPVYCHDDLVATVLLNRRLRCTYPRDYTPRPLSGGIRLAPLRNVIVEQPLPPWIAPAAVLAVDHDRGLRPLEYAAGDGQVTVKVDAVDAVTMLLVCPTQAMAAALRQQWHDLSGAVGGGSPIQPSTVIDDPGNLPIAGRGPWHVSGRRYRAAIALDGPLVAGDWVRAELPIGGDEPDAPLGFFDPGSLTTANAAGEKLNAAVDYYRPIYEPYEQLPLWGFGQGDAPGPLREGRAQVTLDLRGATITGDGAADASAPHSTLRFLGSIDPEYDVLEIRRQGSGDLGPILTYHHTVNGKPQNATLPISRELFDGRVWPESRAIEIPGGRPGVVQLRWLDLIRAAEVRLAAKGAKPSSEQPKATGSAGLRFQLGSTNYRIEQIRQFRSRPLVYVEVPEAIAAGQTRTVYAYWDYALQPPIDSSALKASERPQKATPVKFGPREAFSLAAVDSTLTADRLSKLLLISQAEAAGAWVEARDDRGGLVASRALESEDLLTWQLKETLPLAAEVTSLRALLADDFGHVIAIDLRRPAPIGPLRKIAEVRGQIESLACPDRGDWVLAGAAAVEAMDAEGKARWTVDLGRNPRQPPHFGPGRNVAQVAVRPEGGAALARTFHWNESTRQYEGSDVDLLNPTGRRVAQVPWRWQDAAGFAANGTLRIVPASVPDATTSREPPYTLHRLVTGDGQVIAATTQGRIVARTADGRLAWQTERPSRIDDARLVPSRGLLAIAYKVYPRSWDWRAEAVLELIGLKDGRRVWIGRGEPFDDFGHYGTPLVLAGAADGRRLFLGDSAGRVYRWDEGSRQ